MDEVLFESLLYEEESPTLDFKQEQYRFVGATDDEKSELLKDILAFANAWRRADAYILIGVEEIRGGRSNVLGVASPLNDADLQQFVNSKTQRPVELSYEAYSYKGTRVGIIKIPLQQRPFYLRNSFGRLQANTIYIRRGSSTAIALPDEISEMGATRHEGTDRNFELRALIDELGYFCEMSTQINIMERSVSYPIDSYQRLIDRGILMQLPSDLRNKIRVVYDEIRNANHIIGAAWASGRGGNTWAEGVREASKRLFDARSKAISTINEIRPFLDL
jgi:hypothetical protein